MRSFGSLQTTLPIGRQLLAVAALATVLAPGCGSDSSGAQGRDGRDATPPDNDGGTDAPTASDSGAGDAGTKFPVTTGSGVVECNGGAKTLACLAIPYAAPPTGVNRWRPPQPVVPWAAPRDATTPAKICPQGQLGGPTYDPRSDEDCLTLNVWTPDVSPAKPLPVMIWIHGGAFVFGSGAENYNDGARLVEEGNVVVVTINYRLGALGFLAHHALDDEKADPPTSGNYGIEDQQAALRWVKANIGAFGGDAGNVTIFGESAGGLSVCAHLIAPGSRGLFHKAISQSGLCSGFWSQGLTLVQNYQHGDNLAQAAGCTDAAKVLECLRSKTPEELLAAFPPPTPVPAALFLSGASVALVSQAWTPVVDGTVIPVPIAQVDQGFAKVPLILGTNANEGTIFSLGLFGAAPVTSDADYQAALVRGFSATQAAAIATEYPSSSFPTANDALNEVVGDGFFVCPARRLARDASAAGAPVYLYAFAHVPESPVLPDLGSFHAAELPYVFGADLGLAVTQPDEQPLIAIVQRYWTRFAHTGDPNGGGAPSWPKYAVSTDQNLSLDLPKPTTETGHKQAKCDFWDAL